VASTRSVFGGICRTASDFDLVLSVVREHVDLDGLARGDPGAGSWGSGVRGAVVQPAANWDATDVWLRNAEVALLSEAIRHAPGLQSITVDLEGISDEGMKALSEAIRHAPVLQSISFDREASKTLQSISLDLPHDSSDEGMKALSEAIRHAPALQSVELKGFLGKRSIFDGIVRCQISFH